MNEEHGIGLSYAWVRIASQGRRDWSPRERNVIANDGALPHSLSSRPRAPSCRSTTACPPSPGASPNRAPAAYSWSRRGDPLRAHSRASRRHLLPPPRASANATPVLPGSKTPTFQAHECLGEVYPDRSFELTTQDKCDPVISHYLSIWSKFIIF
jgi:hypothetical protein